MLIVKKYAVTMLPSHKTRQLAPNFYPPLCSSFLPSFPLFFLWINLLFYVRNVSCMWLTVRTIRPIDVISLLNIARVRLCFIYIYIYVFVYEVALSM